MEDTRTTPEQASLVDQWNSLKDTIAHLKRELAASEKQEKAIKVMLKACGVGRYESTTPGIYANISAVVKDVFDARSLHSEYGDESFDWFTVGKGKLVARFGTDAIAGLRSGTTTTNKAELHRTVAA